MNVLMAYGDGDAIQARQTEEPASCIEKTGAELEKVRTKEARIEKGPACNQVSWSFSFSFLAEGVVGGYSRTAKINERKGAPDAIEEE